MVAKHALRLEFSRRLHQACNEAGIRVRGRAVDVQAYLKTQSISATTTAVGKWLNADSLPDAAKLRTLADWLGVRAEWLEYGIPPRKPARDSHADTATTRETVQALPAAVTAVELSAASLLVAWGRLDQAMEAVGDCRVSALARVLTGVEVERRAFGEVLKRYCLSLAGE